MTTFKVGDRVRVLLDLQFVQGKLGTVLDISSAATKMPYVVKIDDDTVTTLVFGENELELVDTPVSQRVRVTVERTVQNAGGGDFIDALGGRLWLHTASQRPGDVVEYLPDPVVLPTKRNAMVRIGSFSTYILANNGLWYRVGTDYTYAPTVLQEWAGNEGYRVIFEGEA